MKRTQFKRGDSQMTRTAFRRRIRKALGDGRKVRAWNKARRSLKVEFEAAGITTCELRLPGCRVDDGLGFAHSLKRRHITTEAQMREVALLDNFCHDIVERQGEAKMQVIIRDIIAKRG